MTDATTCGRCFMHRPNWQRWAAWTRRSSSARRCRCPGSAFVLQLLSERGEAGHQVWLRHAWHPAAAGALSGRTALTSISGLEDCPGQAQGNTCLWLYIKDASTCALTV